MRLSAAITVIWAHSYLVVPGGPINNPIGLLLRFDDGGSLAVKLFFFISGAFVTNSFIKSPSGVQFVAARVSRIFPALIVCALVCIFVMGPAVATIPLKQYFAQTSTFWSVLSRPYVPYTLRGVFTDTPIAYTNGAIWTIRYELAFYAVWLGLGLCGVFRTRWLASALMVGIIAASVLNPASITFIGLPNINNAGDFPALFALGALLAINRDHVTINAPLVCGVIVLVWILKESAFVKQAFELAFVISATWLMSTKMVRAIRLPGDFSYGVYVFGWPIEKTVAWFIPAAGVAVNQTVSIVVALGVGAISWFLVEKPCIALGRKLPKLCRALSERQRAPASRSATILVE
jgi:peptidoglycan/LPS O-acetylase OafA/YrhL